jgi:large subunit ribosomal protein L6
VFGHSLSLYFTYVCILNNLFDGVLTGHSKYIELRGVGFKYKIKSNKLFLILGYSHVTIYELPKNALVNVLNNKLLKVFSINVNIINRVVYSLKKKKMYNVYKGKGIIVKGEVLISKEGKKSNAF